MLQSFKQIIINLKFLTKKKIYLYTFFKDAKICITYLLKTMTIIFQHVFHMTFMDKKVVCV